MFKGKSVNNYNKSAQQHHVQKTVCRYSQRQVWKATTKHNTCERRKTFLCAYMHGCTHMFVYVEAKGECRVPFSVTF